MTKEGYERKLARSREWRAKYPEKAQVTTYRWREANSDRVNRVHREYTAKNRECTNEQGLRSWHKRRAIKYNTTIEKIYKESVFVRDKGVCGICAKDIQGKWHLDHILPLSKGGTHTYQNVQIAHPFCNLRKYNN